MLTSHVFGGKYHIEPIAAGGAGGVGGEQQSTNNKPMTDNEE